MARVPAAGIGTAGVDVRPIAPSYQQTSGLLVDAIQSRNASQNIENAAQKVEGVSNVLANEAIKTQIEDNDRAAKKADVAFSEQTRAIMFGDGTPENPGYYGLKGEAALAAYPKVREQLTEARKKIGGGLTNVQAREMFELSAAGRLDSEGRSMDRHNTQERVTANNAAGLSRINTAISNAINYRSNSDMVGEQEAVLRGEVYSEGDRNGYKPEVTAARLKEELSKMYDGMVNAELVNDPMRAQQMYDKYKIVMDGPTRTVIEKSLEIAVVRKASQDATAKIQAEGGTISQQVEKAKATITDPQVQDAAVQRLKQDWAFNEQVKEKGRRDAARGAWQKIVTGGSVDNLSPQELASMDGTTISSMQQFERNRASRGSGYALASDPATKNDLQKMFMDDKEGFAKADLDQYRSKLTESDYNHWQGMQRTIDSKQETEQAKVANYSLAGSEARLYAKAAGIDPGKKGSNAEKFALINNIANGVVDEAHAQGKKATREDIQKALNAAFLQGRVDDSTILGVSVRSSQPQYKFLGTQAGKNFVLTDVDGQKEQIAKVAEVPVEHVEAIAAALKKAGTPVTIENIKDRYQRGLNSGG